VLSVHVVVGLIEELRIIFVAVQVTMTCILIYNIPYLNWQLDRGLLIW